MKNLEIKIKNTFETLQTSVDKLETKYNEEQEMINFDLYGLKDNNDTNRTGGLFGLFLKQECKTNKEGLIGLVKKMNLRLFGSEDELGETTGELNLLKKGIVVS